MKFLMHLLLLSGIILFNGCSSNHHTTPNIGQVMQVKQGSIQSVKRIKIIKQNRQSTALGAIIGTVTGAVLGSHIGGGSASIVTSTVGGVLGNSLGSKMGTCYENTYGQEILIKLKDGSLLATVLDIEQLNIILHKGQKINILFSGKNVYNIIPVKSYTK